jgi:4-amino-4-deoxy-L-arabinose transferase-like glycosyltransferase
MLSSNAQTARGPRALRRAARADLATRTYWLWLGGALLIGGGLRLALWWQQSRFGVVPPRSDEEEYYRGAIALLKSFSYYDDGQWLRAPLPSIVLALCLALTGGHLPHALALQSLLSGLSILPVAATARSLFNSRRAGIVAGTIAAIYVPFAISAGQMMSEAVAILCSALFVWSVEGWRRTNRNGWLLWAGLALAAFTLTRAVGLYAQVLVIGWIWWRRRSWRATVGAAALFLLGFWLLVGPWTIRNTLALGHVVVVDTNAGFSFWSGTTDPEDALSVQVRLNQTIDDPVERQAAFMERAIDNIQRDPAAWVLASRSKIVAFWQPRLRLLIANGLYTLVPAAFSVPLTLLGDVLFVGVVLAALLGLWFAPPRDRNWLLVAWPIYGTALSAVSLGHPRLRIPFEVALIALSGWVLAHPHQTWQRLARSRWPRIVASAAACFGFVALIASTAYLPFAHSQSYLAAAQVWRWLSDDDRQLDALQSAVNTDPDGALALLALAEAQMERDDPRAKATLERVVALDEQIVPAHAALLRLALERDDQTAIAQRLATIRRIERDDNRLYAWLWQHAARPARTDLVIDGVSDLGLIQGVGAAQRDADGTTLRWTQWHSDLRLAPGPATTLHLRLRGWRSTTIVRVAVEGQTVGACTVGQEWNTCSLPLPASADKRIVTITSPTDVPWPPDDYLPRGVALSRAWLDVGQ